RIEGYVGATGAMAGMYGERFSAEPDLLDALERRLAGRGLLYIDPRAGKPDPRAVIGRATDVEVDKPAIASVIKANLVKLEAIAKRRGSALGVVGWPGPRTVQELMSWAARLPADGLVLAPVTALVRRPVAAEAKR
ncbi:MAG: divergent polysaccharide deacetylase family protein, partial [Acetobacteraceae bacterium]